LSENRANPAGAIFYCPLLTEAWLWDILGLSSK